MRWVETATIRPHRCAAIPFVAGNDEEGFIDTGSELDGFDNHVYISVKAVNEMANLIGRPTITQFREVVQSNQDMYTRLLELTAQRDALQRQIDAVDVLASADFVARRKPGRKAKEEIAA